MVNPTFADYIDLLFNLFERFWQQDSCIGQQFLDTLGPKVMRHQPRRIVVHVSPGQGLYSHAAQCARAHGMDAGTRAAPGGVLPPSPRWSALTAAPAVYEYSVPPSRCLRVPGHRRASG